MKKPFRIYYAQVARNSETEKSRFKKHVRILFAQVGEDMLKHVSPDDIENQRFFLRFFYTKPCDDFCTGDKVRSVSILVEPIYQLSEAVPYIEGGPLIEPERQGP